MMHARNTFINAQNIFASLTDEIPQYSSQIIKKKPPTFAGGFLYYDNLKTIL